MASLLTQPLSTQVEIVDEQGRPTPQFARMLQRLGVGSGLTSSNGQITLAKMAAKTILANKTSGTASPTACTLSDILDFVTTTRGSILFRGASGWQALAPGTAGQILSTGGAGADPSWIAAPTGGGGGGGGTPTIRSSNIASNSWATVNVPFPTGTIAGDVVVVFFENGYGVNSPPAGWTPIHFLTISGDYTNGATIAKIVTASDITTGYVTVTAQGNFNGVYAAVTLTGTTVTSLIKDASYRSGGNASVASAAITGLAGVPSTATVIGFIATRGTMTITVSSGITILQTVNASNASGLVVQVSGAAITKLGLNETATFPVGNNGIVWSLMAFQ